MKKTIFVFIIVAAFTILAAAQDASTPRPTLFDHARPTFASPLSWDLPAIPSTTLFYGGDFNCNDPNSQAFANENTLQISDTETLSAVTIPAGKRVVVDGVFINMAAFVPNLFDPAEATWEIRAGVSEGKGGTQLASGSEAITVVPQIFCAEVPEYEVTVMLTQPQTLTAGTYWFNLTPQCTNTGDSNCSVQQYFVNNTTQGTNNVRGHLQPLHKIYFNSSSFGYDYANWCDPSFGQNSNQCAAVSFGVLGR